MTVPPGSDSATAIPRPRRALFQRMRALIVARPLVAIALVLVTGVAAAGIALTYTTNSTVTTSAVAPPVQFVAGDDAGPAALTRYVSSYALSTNRTYITATVNGVPEASLAIDSFFKITNTDTASRSVVLATPQVTNAYVSGYTLQIYNAAGTLQSTLDLKATTPSASFSIPAGATHYAKLTLTLASGAGADNVALSNGISLSVA